MLVLVCVAWSCIRSDCVGVVDCVGLACVVMHCVILFGRVLVCA